MAVSTDHISSDILRLSDDIDIFLVLNSFQQHKQSLNLSSATSKQSFSTMILECDQNKTEFKIDKVASTDKNSFSPKHDTKYNLEGVLDGIYYQLKGCYWIGDDDSYSSGGHRLQFPSEIYHQQRRQTFRTAVPRSINSCIEISDCNNQHRCNGRIMDISVTGLACEYTPEEDSDAVATIEDLKQQKLLLTIRIDKIIDTKCLGKIKDLIPTKKLDHHRFGLEFESLDKTTERLISKAVVDLQRLTRKNQTR